LSITLSPREEQIVRLAAHGYPNKIIAHELNISTWTVNTHLRRIFAKLQVCSKTAMVVRYLESQQQGLAGS
jgi:DNA-binding NarL/FixJ family response regulator